MIDNPFEVRSALNVVDLQRSGACAVGVFEFMADHGITTPSVSVETALRLAAGVGDWEAQDFIRPVAGLDANGHAGLVDPRPGGSFPFSARRGHGCMSLHSPWDRGNGFSWGFLDSTSGYFRQSPRGPAGDGEDPCSDCVTYSAWDLYAAREDLHGID